LKISNDHPLHEAIAVPLNHNRVYGPWPALPLCSTQDFTRLPALRISDRLYLDRGHEAPSRHRHGATWAYFDNRIAGWSSAVRLRCKMLSAGVPPAHHYDHALSRRGLLRVSVTVDQDLSGALLASGGPYKTERRAIRPCPFSLNRDRRRMRLFD
jgi:hypothetical protein